MSTVDATSSSTSSSSSVESNPIGYTVKAQKKVLDSSDFMKLLATQMSNQDPLKPMDDTAFVSQMASFTALEQTNTLVTNSNSMLWNQSVVTANSCLGKTVTVLTGETNSDGTAATVTGQVTGVDYTESEVRVKIGETYYGISNIQSIDNGTTTPDSTSTGS